MRFSFCENLKQMKLHFLFWKEIFVSLLGIVNFAVIDHHTKFIILFRDAEYQGVIAAIRWLY